MNFAKHVFISYAHIDNDVAIGVPRGWVDHLQEHLQLRLAQLLGYRPTIWRDKAELKGNYVFRDTIAIGLGETGVFLSILSPRYLESASCRDELEGFLNAAQVNGGLLVSDRHRIFKVIKTPVEFTLHPEPIRDLLGYEFFAQDPINKRFREFDHEISPKGEKDKRYWDKLDDLAQDICALLKEMQGAPAPKPGATIFLAQTTDDLMEQRDNVKRELQQNGHVILPDQQLPTSRPQLESMVRDCLQRSRMSVHLIGAEYGFIPGQEQERSFVWLQEELARERSQSQHSDFSHLIWLPPELEPQDERQRKFIESLQNNFHSINGSDLLRGKIEDLKTIIQKRLTEPPPITVNTPDSGLTRIYLICDQRDLDDVQPLYPQLFDAGFEVVLPSTEASALQDNQQNLRQCDAVLFYYGAGNEMWLRTQIGELNKAAGYGRTAPLLAKGIYVAGPETPQKKMFMTREAVLMKHFGSFAPDDLQPFLDAIRSSQGGAQ